MASSNQETFLTQNETTDAVRQVVQLVSAFIALISLGSLGVQTLVFHGNNIVLYLYNFFVRHIVLKHKKREDIEM